MAISDRITSIEEHIKESYQELEGIGIDTTGVNNNLENIPKLIDGYWETLPKVTGEGTSITLDNTKEGKMKINLKGNTSQEGTPTPETPQDIHVVSGDNSINVVGKNLFIPTLKVDDTNISTTRCSVSLSGDEYTFSATGSDCYFGNIVGTGNAYNKVLGTLYDVSGITNLVFKPTNSAFDKNYVCYYDKNKVSLGYVQINNNTGLITPIANTKYIGFRIGINNSVSGTNYTTKVQLEKGSTPSEYEKHIGNTYPVNLPVENLWSLSDIYTSTNGNQWVLTDTAFHLSKGTYTISFDATVNKTVQFNFKDGNNVAHQVNVGTNGTFTTDVDLEKVAIYISSANNTISNIQLEKGSKANSYTPYGTTPIELCKIGDYQDSIVKDNGKWYVNKQIGKVVLNGTGEAWQGASTSGNYTYFYTNTLDSLSSSDSYIYCDKFNVSLTSINVQTTVNEDTIYYGGTQYAKMRIMILSSRLTANTVSAFKTWLQSNNVIVYYVLATPTTTEITDSTLLSQLEALSGAKSYNPQTNVSQVNNDLPFILTTTALREMA